MFPRSTAPVIAKPATAIRNPSALPQRPSIKCPAPGTIHAASTATGARTPRFATLLALPSVGLPVTVGADLTGITGVCCAVWTGASLAGVLLTDVPLAGDSFTFT
jgi:hypothetical protein